MDTLDWRSKCENVSQVDEPPVPSCVFAGDSYHHSRESRRSLAGKSLRREVAFRMRLGGSNTRFEPRLSLISSSACQFPPSSSTEVPVTISAAEHGRIAPDQGAIGQGRHALSPATTRSWGSGPPTIPPPRIRRLTYSLRLNEAVSHGVPH
jgi:hypothetical protein